MCCDRLQKTLWERLSASMFSLRALRARRKNTESSLMLVAPGASIAVLWRLFFFASSRLRVEKDAILQTG
jgi:hypothetical protein